MNLEKQKAINTAIRHSINDAKDITDLKEINACILKFYNYRFKNKVSKSNSEMVLFLNSIALPNLNSKSFDICESEITDKDLITALKTIPNGKSPGVWWLKQRTLWTLLGRFKILFHYFLETV